MELQKTDANLRFKREMTLKYMRLWPARRTEYLETTGDAGPIL